MTRYDVYLELGADGEGMAHVPDLPGCHARGRSADAALAALPAAIRAIHASLRRHGAALPDPEPITLGVAETITFDRPFRQALGALFASDRAPATPADLARCFRYAATSRADLLALVRGLPAAVLDWTPGAGALSIRAILRHVGNAEEWYVSRLVDPASLPPTWDQDAAMPIFPFLTMERRTVQARLEALTAAERAALVYPTTWTDDPSEPWTARKALRRLLEHEREHIAQVEEMLAAWRAHLLARLAGERAVLFGTLVGLAEEPLIRQPAVEGWTAKDLLAHIAAWDELFTDRAARFLDGRAAEIASVELDARNAALYEERKDWSLDQAVAACVDARSAFLATLARASDGELHHAYRLPWGATRTIRRFAQWRARHDASHGEQLARWRRRAYLPAGVGPKALLRAALDAGQAELLALVALAPDEERATRPLCGDWTLQDVLGHLADREQDSVAGLREAAAGPPPRGDMDGEGASWEAARVAARCGQSWDQVWADWRAAQATLAALLDGFSQEDLARSYSGRPTTAGWIYDGFRAALTHRRAHAAALRAGLGLAGPRRLQESATSVRDARPAPQRRGDAEYGRDLASC